MQACELMDALKKNLRQEHVLIHEFLSTFYTQVAFSCHCPMLLHQAHWLSLYQSWWQLYSSAPKSHSSFWCSQDWQDIIMMAVLGTSSRH